jgi:hypothetical protein
MASGDTVSGAVNIQKVQDVILKLWSVVKALPEISSDQKNRNKSLYEGVVCSLNNPDSKPLFHSSQLAFVLPVPTTTSYWCYCGHLTLLRQDSLSLTTLETQGRQHLGI